MRYDVKCFENMKYIIRYPENYEQGKRYPVLFFLHGAGSRGADVNLLRSNPFFCLTDNYAEFPFITVAPQCSADTWFDLFSDLKELVLDILELDYVDSERVYAIGASMGGYAVWQLAMSLPDAFSAIVPICGGGMYWNAHRLKDVNVWAFHGVDDDVVFARETQEMVKRIQNAGGNAVCTLYENTGHDSWSQTYSNPEVFKWFLKFKKKTGSDVPSEDIYSNSELFG